MKIRTLKPSPASRWQIAWYGLLVLGLWSCVSTTGPKHARQIVSVTIAGNKTVTDDVLIDGLESRPPSGILRRKHVRVDRHALESDRARIETYYHSKGFFSASVASPALTEIGGDEVAIQFAVEEGPPSLVSSIRLTGVPDRDNCSDTALRQRLHIGIGKRFEHEAYLRSKDALLDQLVEHGYAYAKVSGDVRVHPLSHTVDVELVIQAGPKARFGKTTVTGLGRVPLSAVLNRLAWKEGETFDAGKLWQTRMFLNELRLFSTVRVDYDPSVAMAEVPMRITVVEARRRTIRLGGGAGIDRVRWELRGRAGYEVSHVFGLPLTTLSLQARPAYATIRGIGGERAFVGEFRTSLLREDLFLPMLRGSAALSYAVEEIEAYTAQGASFHLSATRPFLNRRLYVSAGYRFRLIDFLRVSDAIDSALATDLGLQSPYRIAMSEQSITYDRRDNPVSPHAGFWAELRLQQARKSLGSEFAFTTLSPELRGFVPLGQRVTIAARARFGLLVTGSDLPITSRYFGGGATGHRGFPQRHLSPVARSGDETVGIGGSALWESSLEGRIDTWQIAEQWLSFAVFLDAGDVRMDVDELDLLDPHLALGVGLRYRTLVGPLRLDLGYRLNRKGAEEPEPGQNWAFHFTLGEAF